MVFTDKRQWINNDQTLYIPFTRLGVKKKDECKMKVYLKRYIAFNHAVFLSALSFYIGDWTYIDEKDNTHA